MVFIGEESSKRRVNAYIPKYIFMAYYIVFLWTRGRDGTRSKITGNFLLNSLHTFHRFNKRYHIKNFKIRNVMVERCLCISGYEVNSRLAGLVHQWTVTPRS